MRSEVFWIDFVGRGLLGIMPRPCGGDWLDGEIQALAKAGVNMLIALLKLRTLNSKTKNDSAAILAFVSSRSRSPIEACRTPWPKQAAPST